MSLQRSGRFQRIKKPLNSDMNVVPYIDVMLVLLVIFMVTAPMITSSIKVDLPQASSSPFQSKTIPATVTINKAGAYILKYHQYNDQVMNLAQLKTALAQAQQQSQAQKQDLVVLVNGDKSRPYGDVVALMSELQAVGLSQVGLLTESAQP